MPLAATKQAITLESAARVQLPPPFCARTHPGQGGHPHSTYLSERVADADRGETVVL